MITNATIKSGYSALVVLALAVFAYAIWSASQLPIYPDEVAYKIFLERFFLNGGFKQTVTPYCMSGFLVRPSVILLPAAAVWSGLQWLDSGWLSYRILSMLALLSIVAMLASNAWRSKSAFPWPAILLISVGPVIYGLIILRPEVFILAGGLALFLGVRYLLSETLMRWRAAITMVLLGCFSLLGYMHPKAMYLTPLLALGLVFSGFAERRMLARVTYLLISLAMTVWIAMAAINLHKTQFVHCPEVPAIENAMNRQAVNILSVFSDFPKFVVGIREAASTKIALKTVNQLSFQPNYDINYLPSEQTLGWVERSANILNLAVIAATLVIVLTGSWIFRNKIPPRENLLTVMLMLGYLLPFFLNLTRHWYEISFLVGALMVLAGVYWPYFYAGPIYSRVRITWPRRAWISLVMLASVATLYLEDAHFTQKFSAGFSGPGISILADRVKIKREITSLLDEQHVDSRAPLVIDDMTYDTLKYRPIVMPYTYLLVGGTNPEVVKSALRHFDVHHGVIRCSHINTLSPAYDWKIIAQTPEVKNEDRICLISLYNE